MQLETRVQHRVHFEETLEGTSIVLAFDFCFLILEQAPSSSSFNLSFFFVDLDLVIFFYFYKVSFFLEGSPLLVSVVITS